MLAQHVSKSIGHFVLWHDEPRSESLFGRYTCQIKERRRSQESIEEIVQKSIEIQIKIESCKVLIQGKGKDWKIIGFYSKQLRNKRWSKKNKGNQGYFNA